MQKKTMLLAAAAIVAVVVIVGVVMILGIGKQNPSNGGPATGNDDSWNNLTIPVNQTQMVQIQKAMVGFDYRGAEGLFVGVMINGHPNMGWFALTNNISVSEDDTNWSTYDESDSYHDYSLHIEWRISSVTTNSITLDYRDNKLLA